MNYKVVELRIIFVSYEVQLKQSFDRENITVLAKKSCSESWETQAHQRAHSDPTIGSINWANLPAATAISFGSSHVWVNLRSIICKATGNPTDGRTSSLG